MLDRIKKKEAHRNIGIPGVPPFAIARDKESGTDTRDTVRPARQFFKISDQKLFTHDTLGAEGS